MRLRKEFGIMGNLPQSMVQAARGKQHFCSSTKIESNLLFECVHKVSLNGQKMIDRVEAPDVVL